MFGRLSIVVVLLALAMPVLVSSCGRAVCAGGCGPPTLDVTFRTGTSVATAQTALRRWARHDPGVVSVGSLKVENGHLGVSIQTKQIEDGTLITCLDRSDSLAGTPVSPA